MGPSTKMTVSNVMVRQQAAMYLRVRSQRGSSLPVKIHQLCRRHQRADAGRKDVGVLGVKEEHLLFAPVPAHGQGNGLCAHDEQFKAMESTRQAVSANFFMISFLLQNPLRQCLSALPASPKGGGLRQTENFISVLKPRPSREVAARKR